MAFLPMPIIFPFKEIVTCPACFFSNAVEIFGSLTMIIEKEAFVAGSPIKKYRFCCTLSIYMRFD